MGTPPMDKLEGKLIHKRLNLTSSNAVTTTESRMRTNDPQRRKENELLLLRNLSPDVQMCRIRKVAEMIPRKVVLCVLQLLF
jgi:hypothetical protein